MQNFAGGQRFARVADLGKQGGKLHLFAHVEIVVGSRPVGTKRQAAAFFISKSLAKMPEESFMLEQGL